MKGLVLQRQNRQGDQLIALFSEFSGFLEELCPVCVLESSFLSVQPVSFWVHWLQGWGADRWTQMTTDEPTQGSRHAFNIESKIKRAWFSLGSLSTWLCSLKGGFLTWHSHHRSLCPLHCCRAAVLSGPGWQLPSGAAGGRGHECKKGGGTCLILSFHKPKEVSRSLQLGVNTTWVHRLAETRWETAAQGRVGYLRSCNCISSSINVSIGARGME